MVNEACYFMGFDFGMRYIGLAIGQMLTKTASPLTTLYATDGIPDWFLLDQLVQKWRPAAMIVGLPKKMDGTEQAITEAARNFADSLRARFGLPVHYVDERLTTKEARSRLFEQGGYRALLSKEKVDQLSAKLLLEDWLATA